MLVLSLLSYIQLCFEGGWKDFVVWNSCVCSSQYIQLTINLQKTLTFSEMISYKLFVVWPIWHQAGQLPPSIKHAKKPIWSERKSLTTLSATTGYKYIFKVKVCHFSEFADSSLRNDHKLIVSYWNFIIYHTLSGNSYLNAHQVNIIFSLPLAVYLSDTFLLNIKVKSQVNCKKNTRADGLVCFVWSVWVISI